MLSVPPCIGHSTSAGRTETTRPHNISVTPSSHSPFMTGRSLRSIGPPDIDRTVLAAPTDSHTPRIAADLAVLHEGAANVRLDIDLDLLATERTDHREESQHLQ